LYIKELLAEAVVISTTATVSTFCLLQRRRRYTVRIQVPADLRTLIGRAELWRSTRTAQRRQATSAAALLHAHFSCLFSQLRRHRGTMSRSQLDALVAAAHMETELEEIEAALVLNVEPTGRDETGFQWNERCHEIGDELAAGDLRRTLPLAQQMLPAADELTIARLARRLLEAQLEATKQGLKGLEGEPLQAPAGVPAASPAVAPKPSPALTQVCRSSAHAAPCLRVQAGERRARHPRFAAVARAQEHPAYGTLHGAVGRTIQGLLAIDDL
jgi:hypothetical protein